MAADRRLDASATSVPVAGRALLEAGSVSVRFGGLHALDDVDLALGEGEIAGLIGPNGAGKTTMFNVLCGLVRPTRGSVHLAGSDVTRWSPHRRGRAGIARTFQRLELFGRMTVADNLLSAWESSHPGAVLGRGRGRKRRKVAEVVEQLGLGPHLPVLASVLPTGLGRVVELGRALCTDPRVLLLDEPSSGLDASETARLRDVLCSVTGRGREPGSTSPSDETTPAVLLVEHDMALVMDICDRIVVLDFGKKIAEGTPDEVRNDPLVRAAYLGDADVA